VGFWGGEHGGKPPVSEDKNSSLYPQNLMEPIDIRVQATKKGEFPGEERKNKVRGRGRLNH